MLRRDRELIERAATTASVAPWQDAAPETAELIAEHNLRLGQPDHPEFVRMRYAQWAECARVLVFDARAGSHHGVLTALVWRDGLELHEIGLPPSDRPGPAGALPRPDLPPAARLRPREPADHHPRGHRRPYA